MDKYGVEKPELKSRTELNADLYQSTELNNYNKVDLNSNVSVLDANAKNIDVDLIKEMLDKKYRENLPKRKSIHINIEEDEVYHEKVDTKEYDINEILAKARTEQKIDYNKERLKKLSNTNYEILQNLDIDLNDAERYDDEHELMTLINTITQLELENKEKAKKAAGDLLDMSDESNTEEIEKPVNLENSFYTGNLAVSENDYEDFKDIQKDIKSNSVLITILIIIFVIIVIAVGVFLLNKYFNWGLF